MTSNATTNRRFGDFLVDFIESIEHVVLPTVHQLQETLLIWLIRIVKITLFVLEPYKN